MKRRSFLAMGSSSIACIALTPFTAFASKAGDAISEFTGGAKVGEGVIELNAPAIAENGNSVPIDFVAPGAKSVTIFADGNPEPIIAEFSFGKLNPTKSASTRVRLHKTQTVIAVAKMEDGSFQRAQSNVKVTIGGCGG